MNILTVLTGFLYILKVANIINISWWQVFIPIYLLVIFKIAIKILKK